ncbi:hypothetical protein AWM75_06365 [Aerococcus urinaehominis]|uniref:Competence protein CoiA n=1 Tax=Aerococcus urinaehominis TaxID=128944 RepID=A0A0X8FLR1_9LACT|nr:competence protein CoiA family protein [Aerococcus urinaehominis]AMB99629.1 hypothetical protein AWM75_06365 [Aerococcus urinaehominis]SDL87991.1 Competence protein CoiA-like family, contains a predicted nuclease domain [Aerococcus urinaehominis]
MFYAKDGLGNWVRADEVIGATNSGPYFCPKCEQVLQFKAGTKRRPYFAHQISSVNQMSKGESSQHRLAKEDLYQNLSQSGYQVRMEVDLKKVDRRADLLIEDQAKLYSWEIQYALLSSSDSRAREEDHLQVGCQLIWLLGQDSPHYRYNKCVLDRLTNFMTYHQQLGWFVAYYQGAQLPLKLVALDLWGKPYRSYLIQPADYLHLLGDLGRNYQLGHPQRPLANPNIRVEAFIKRCLLSRNACDRKLLIFLYQHGTSLQSLPVKIFQWQRKLLFFKQDLWQVLTYLYVLGPKLPTRERHQAVLDQLDFRPHARANCGLYLDFISWLEGQGFY